MNKPLLIAIPLAVASIFLVLPFVAYYGDRIMVTTSYSMVPTLQPNDLIVVREMGIGQVEEGDIIAFDSHMEHIGIIAHRAHEIMQDKDTGEITIHTKGDDLDNTDPWVVHDKDLIGKVIDVVPRLGIFMIEPVRYTLVAVIVITAIALFKESFASSKSSKSSQIEKNSKGNEKMTTNTDNLDGNDNSSKNNKNS